MPLVQVWGRQREAAASFSPVKSHIQAQFLFTKVSVLVLNGDVQVPWLLCLPYFPAALCPVSYRRMQTGAFQIES